MEISSMANDSFVSFYLSDSASIATAFFLRHGTDISPIGTNGGTAATRLDRRAPLTAQEIGWGWEHNDES
jgi:hypothetical protein